MKEARLVLPIDLHYNSAMFATLNELANAFGGLTEWRADGRWKPTSGVNLIFEPVRIVEVAYSPSRENDEKLYDIARRFLMAANQEAVYLRYGNGHVQMVTEKSCIDNGEFEWEAFRKDIHRDADALTDTIAVPEHVAIV